jgi:hypothetical protein
MTSFKHNGETFTLSIPGFNKDLLNAAKKLIVEFANDNNIVISESFPNKKSFNEFVISLTIKSIMQILKVDIKDAWNMVFGDDSYKQFAENVFDSVNK